MGINYKGESIIFKKIRKEIAELKDNFFEAKSETVVKVLNYFNLCLHFVISLFIWFAGIILCLILKYRIVGLIVAIMSVVYIILATTVGKVFKMTGYMSYKLLFYLFGRYGKVVTRQDWKNVKKYGKVLYKDLFSKESYGHCYYYSRALAMYLEDAQLMYCSIPAAGEITGHSVIVKNNCVYDTNDRRHYDYEEYIKKEVEIYKFFSEEDYRKESFFDDIRQDFVEWCAERNVYCSPQE